METQMTFTFETALTVIKPLPLIEKMRLIEWIAAQVKQELVPISSPPAKRSLRGLWADLGTAPSDEDIAEMRREAWANFLQEDIE